MTTSLAAQLQRLAAPQTSLLYDSRKKPSILFEAGKAASKDREVIYDIGVSGLEELIQLNPSFAQFEDTLFDKTSIDLQRSVENQEINRKLDANIRKFFFHLSPYFMLQPAHKCLEWLIRRFHIHEFNREDFVNLILPYHETLIFVRCVQTLHISGSNDPFYWLQGVKKSGVPISKKAIVNHAKGSFGFLRNFGQFLEGAIKELDFKANILQSMIAFYCTTTIGVLEALDSVGEQFVTAVIKTLVKGLSSKSIDFTAASYMVIGYMITKTSLRGKSLEIILNRVCGLMHPALAVNAAMLIVLIFQTQHEQIGELSEQLIGVIMGSRWLPAALSVTQKNGVDIVVLMKAVLGKCLKKICRQDAELEACKKFCEGLLLEITLTQEESEVIIQCVLDTYFHKNPAAAVAKTKSTDGNTSEVISLDSDEEDFERKDDVVTLWYSDFLKRLENQYPNGFDGVVKRIMKGQDSFSQNKRNALRNVLSFLMQASYSENDTSVFENLFHYDTDRRANAVHYLVENFASISLKGDGSCELLRDSIKERLEDNHPEVFAEVLKLGTAELVKLIGKDELIAKLAKVSLKCLRYPKKWESVTLKLIDLLTDKEVYGGTNLNKIIIILYPFLFPTKEDDKQGEIVAQHVLGTEFARKHNITMLAMQKMDSFDCESILNTLEEMFGDGENLHAIQVCFNVLLVASSLPQTAPLELALRVFDFVIRLLGRTFKYAPSSSLSNLRFNRLPMDIHVIVTGYLIERVEFDSQYVAPDLSNQSKSLSLQLKMFTLLVEKYFAIGQKNEAIKQVYGSELSKFLKQVYPQPEQRVEFLARIYTAHLVVSTDGGAADIQPEVQVMSFKLLNAMLKQVAFQLTPSILLSILLGLTSDSAVIRECALITLDLIATNESCTQHPDHRSFLRKLLKRRDELAMDGEQLALVMFTVFSHDKSNSFAGILNELLSGAVDAETPEYIAGGILEILKLLDDETIFARTVPRGVRILQQVDRSRSYIFSAYETKLLKLLIARINPNTAANLRRSEQCREFVRMVLQSHQPLRSADRKHITTSILMIETISDELFETFSSPYAGAVLRLVVQAATVAQNAETNAAAGKLFKGLKLDAALFLHLLDDMMVPQGKKKDKSKAESENTFSLAEWKHGVTLLELLQNKKSLTNHALLVPKLFDVLRFCLDFEEQSGLEYVKQMILSLLLHCCAKCEEAGETRTPLPANALKVELIVQCIRGTQNPQTHHHALLLLAHVSYLVPEQVLHNMMEIFTFMGSSIVRHDDVYSIQIISKIIETIVPTLALDRKSSGEKSQDKVIAILKIFSDVILDVPEHRRVPLYTKLIQTLGASDYLWMFLGVLLESDVMKGGRKSELESEEKTRRKKHRIESEHSPNFSKRLEIAMNIVRDFPPKVIIETCTRLIQYIQELPVQISSKRDRMEIDLTQGGDCEIFGIENHSNKQLRHYRYSTSLFVSTLIRSTQVINAIALLDDKQTEGMKVCYRDLIVSSLAYVNVVSKVVDKSRSDRDERENSYWEICLTKCYEILEGTISLLAPDMMITVFVGLLKHKTLMIRLKVIDIFNKKLQYHQDYFDESHHPRLLELLTPLMHIIKGIFKEENVVGSNTGRFKIAQEAYLTFKHLSKILAHQNPVQFKEVLSGMMQELHDYKKNPNSQLLASLILCIGEVSVNIGAHSIPFLPKYIPMLTRFITHQLQSEEVFDILTSSIVTSILKLIDALSRFLSPYLTSIIVGTSKLQAKLGTTEDPRLSNISNRLTQIWEKLASLIPLRLLVPAIEDSYNELIKAGSLDAIGPLMRLLSNSFNHIQTNEFSSLQSELSDFFLSALQFRCDHASGGAKPTPPGSIDLTEEHVIKAFVVLILKLSESTFRPLYYKVFEWATRDNSSNDRAITFFNLSSHAADALKHLFVLFASELITNAAKLLEATNAGKIAAEDELFFSQPKKNVTLIRYILRTLLSVLVHDNQNFINAIRFDTLMQPIVDQLENSLVLAEDDVRRLVVDCLSQLVVAVADDTLWRQLNHQVLLKTRNNDPEIRLFALEACTDIVRRIGENFAPLLPESIPFLAELMEDENQAVERAVKRTIREVEKVTGEPLHKYL
ncbi:HEAT repeat-containing protein 1 homolog [Toxorhynchites rutilus septentrionalis]|uniref:HEAT repeat-containing protein 1 homolog n=1 Tax=Toxorhynchites rutilus septentrionalis TaxID=329112 RepID=UPI0024797B97|nr:HEAT repeat-containing protein 1 homolog [Toxorhynchites rutilus septentrionalis]